MLSQRSGAGGGERFNGSLQAVSLAINRTNHLCPQRPFGKHLAHTMDGQGEIGSAGFRIGLLRPELFDDLLVLDEFPGRLNQDQQKLLLQGHDVNFRSSQAENASGRESVGSEAPARFSTGRHNQLCHQPIADRSNRLGNESWHCALQLLFLSREYCGSKYQADASHWRRAAGARRERLKGVSFEMFKHGIQQEMKDSSIV